jgi:hypothetical protein
MENRKLHQIVFVVMDNYEQKILGVYNEYTEAVQLAEAANKDIYTEDTITITPVLVDTININPDSRALYWNEQDVVDALQEEIDLAAPYEEEEDEEDEEDEDDWEWDEDEFEDEDEEEEEDDDEETPADPIESMIIMCDGKRALRESDATLIADTIKDLIEMMSRGESEAEKKRLFTDTYTELAKNYNIEYVVKD